MAALLQNTKHHNLHKRANMETVSSAVKADIGRNAVFGCQRVKRLNISGLMNVATFAKLPE